MDWYPWCNEAFQAARAENKPIFLSIGYSTCYWCHMMEKDSFEKQEVADVLNKHFISIKVDREEHPEVDQIYMDAVVTLTGQGGWPLSVFLTPDLKPVTGATFFWKDQFLSVLNHMQNLWEKEPEKLLQQAAELTQFLNQKSAAAPKEILQEIFQTAFEELESHFDAAHGGFGGAPKFPQPFVLQLLMRIGRRSQNQKALEMVVKTLEAMAAGEIFDKVGGGFHRYATQADWNEPHYEKMLYDNALLATTFLEAFQATKRGRFGEGARRTLDYVLRDMTRPEGGFYSAQDAGPVGKEGEYYRWSEAEKKLSPEALFKIRQKRTPPHKDDKILTSWNGLMIGALARGYQVLGEEKYLKAAQAAAHFIRARLFKEGKLLRRFREEESLYAGTLDDYAFLIDGLLHLYESDFDLGWLEWAKGLQKSQDEIFWDEEEAGYFFSDPNEKTLVIHKKEYHDGALPSGNAVSALNLLRLFGLTCEKSYHDLAESLLKRFAKEAEKYPTGFAQALIAIDFLKGPPKEIAVVGPLKDEGVQTLRAYLYQTFLPNKVLAFGELPALQGKKMLREKPTFYICENHFCKAPTNDWEEAKRQIQE